jgi:hypothetical protein
MSRISGTVRLASRMIEDDLDDYEILDVSTQLVPSQLHFYAIYRL